jgi:tetratricopeptide (TPR) repeat protein
MYMETLKLITNLPARKPIPGLPDQLSFLFKRLSSVIDPAEATMAEDGIWSLWMTHPNSAAERVLNLATDDIAARRFDIADTRLTRLLRCCPDYPEAWNKRATLYYMLGRDEESIADIQRALQLEPRHFGALAGFGEICLEHGDSEAALIGFHAALRLHPHLQEVIKTCRRIRSEL